MIIAMSRFKVANGMEAAVADAFLKRPQLVDHASGFLGIETFTESNDRTTFYLVTRWTDGESFRRWHHSEAHHRSHRSIPKGLKLDPSYTKVIEMDRLCDTTRLATLRQVVSDQSALFVSFIKDSQNLHLIAADLDGRIACCNAAVAQHLNCAADDMAGQRIWEMLTDADAVRLRERIAAGGGDTGDTFLLNWLDASQSPYTLVCKLDLQPDGFVILGEPPQKKEAALQDQLLQLNNELATLTRENTRKKRELQSALATLKETQAMLVHQEKMAALGQMTAGVAHEINNPLAFVLGNHATLRKDFADLLSLLNLVGDSLAELGQSAPALRDRILDRAEQIDLGYLAEAIPRKIADNLEGLERVKEIVLDLRRFSRLDEGGFKPVDLAECLTTTLRFLTPLINEHGVTVRTEFSELPQLMCAPGTLNQAFSNLIANAIQASRPGQEVKVCAALAGDRCVVTVEDSGVGIAPENLAKVFDPFFTTRTVGEGVGLGLHITRQIITAHRGEIKIASAQGQGTTVRVELPLSTESERPLGE